MSGWRRAGSIWASGSVSSTTRGKGAENAAEDAIGVFSMAMWMFNLIANCGVMCGVGSDGPVLYARAQKIENPAIDDL